MKSKKVGVLFSGGLDSTYLIWKNLKKGNTVVPYYIEIKNNKDKVILEKNRTELILEEFRKEFPNKVSNLCVGMEVDINTCCGLKYTQMPIWMLGVLFFQDETIDEFHIGYVCGDDMISYLDDIKGIYDSYKIFRKHKTKLKFPISKKHKYTLYSKLPEQYLKLTVTCEQPILINNEMINFDDLLPKKITYGEKFELGKPVETVMLVNDIEICKSTNDKIIKYKPCGECDPCKKILNSYANFYGYGFGNNIYEDVRTEKLFKHVNWNYYKFSDDQKKILENQIKEVSLQKELDIIPDAHQLNLFEDLPSECIDIDAPEDDTIYVH